MNIKEIAQMAGVSKAAVSRYLNNGYLSEEKRSVIQKVIEETGYVPSTYARTLRTNKSKIIGVVIPKINSESISRIVAGISSVLSLQGYQLFLASTDNNAAKELDCLMAFKTNNVDGIILIATMFTPKHNAIIKEVNIPIVMIGQKYDGHTCVFHDDFGAAYAVTKELLSHKKKNLGYIGVTTSDISAGLNRKNGFLAAARDLKIKIIYRNMLVSKFTKHSGYDTAKELFELSPNIDCVFCATDTIALGVMKYLRDCKKTVPDDVLICGVGGSDMGEIISPGLTTARLNYYKSGVVGAKELLKMLNHKKIEPKDIQMDFELIIRESTMPSKTDEII